MVSRDMTTSACDSWLKPRLSRPPRPASAPRVPARLDSCWWLQLDWRNSLARVWNRRLGRSLHLSARVARVLAAVWRPETCFLRVSVLAGVFSEASGGSVSCWWLRLDWRNSLARVWSRRLGRSLHLGARVAGNRAAVRHSAQRDSKKRGCRGAPEAPSVGVHDSVTLYGWVFAWSALRGGSGWESAYRGLRCPSSGGGVRSALLLCYRRPPPTQPE